MKTTYAMDYNLAFEHALSNNFVATIGYVGTLGRHLPVSINTNSSTVLLPSGSAQAYLPFPDFGGSSDMLYEGISEYNALQTKLQKRLSHGLDFSANYTWSHALDDAANPLGGGIGYRNTNIIPIRDDMTNSSWMRVTASPSTAFISFHSAAANYLNHGSIWKTVCSAAGQQM